MSIKRLINQWLIIASLESLNRATTTKLIKPPSIEEKLPPTFKRVEVRTTAKCGRNEPCTCGSGKKNKQCCKQF
jgi:uncharacterized protein YecA (UPF0149 family)